MAFNSQDLCDAIIGEIMGSADFEDSLLDLFGDPGALRSTLFSEHEDKLTGLEFVSQSVERRQSVSEAVSDDFSGKLIDVESPEGFVLFLSRGLRVSEVFVWINGSGHKDEDIIWLI
jgi:hypothetical protein